MKKLFIIYNILFLMTGNALFGNIHSHHDHGHFDEHEALECQECIMYDSSNNYILDSKEELSLFDNINELIQEETIIVPFITIIGYPSRAPPIS